MTLDNPRPLKLSTQEELCDLRKSCVEKVLDDDYNPRDSLDASIKVKGSHPDETFLKVNTSLAARTADGSMEFKHSDNLEFRANMFGLNMKGKVKGNKFLEHYDLGLKQWNVNCRGTERTLWFNPYFRWSSSTSLTNMGFNLGAVSYWCKHMTTRTQLNYNPTSAVEGKSAWSVCSRKQLTKGKFWMDYCGGFNLAALRDISMKKLRMGWNEQNWGLTMQLNKVSPFKGGCPVKDSVWVGGVWRNASLGALVGRVKYFLDDRPMGCEVGLQRKMNDKLTIKGKVDCDWNLNLMAKFSCCKSVTWETSLMSNLVDSEKVTGLFDLPLKVGLKMKINK